MTTAANRWLQQQDLSWIESCDQFAIKRLLEGLRAIPLSDRTDVEGLNLTLRELVLEASKKVRTHETSTAAPVTPPDDTDFATTVANTYRHWNHANLHRHRLLALLAWLPTRSNWTTFAELMVSDPPSAVNDVVEACMPLWKQPTGPVSALFPKLMEAIQHPSAAAVVLDLANFLAETRAVSRHPAHGREKPLLTVLGQVVSQLENYESSADEQMDQTTREQAMTVTESISLAISFTNTLTSLKCHDAIGLFYRLQDLRHRRLRVEAAWALASLGDASGGKTLVEMAAEPVVRRRVLAYADELSLSPKIDSNHRTDEAIAEAKLAEMLAEPRWFGMPPNDCEPVDHRRLFWPGYDEPVACYLLKFRYELPAGEFSNVAIVGPTTHCLPADLEHLDSRQLYGLFAGLDVEHEDLKRWPAEKATGSDEALINQAARWVESQGYQQVEPRLLVSCFGQLQVVLQATQSGQIGTAIVDRDHIDWVPQGNPQRPIDAETAYALVLGQSLLDQFNDTPWC